MPRCMLRLRSYFDCFVLILIASGLLIIFSIAHVNINKPLFTDSDTNPNDHNKTVIQHGVKLNLYNISATKLKHTFSQEPKVSFASRRIETTGGLTEQPTYAQNESKVSIVRDNATKTEKKDSTITALRDNDKRGGNQQLKVNDSADKMSSFVPVSNNTMKIRLDKFDHENLLHQLEKSSTRINIETITSRIPKQRFHNIFRNLSDNRIAFLRRFKNTLNNKMMKLGIRKKRPTEDEFEKEDRNIPERKDTCNACFKKNFQILLNQETMCKDLSNIDVLILISSAPPEKAQREAIRKTWGSNCNHVNSSIKCIFVIGNFRSPLTTNASKEIDNLHSMTNIQRQLEKESLHHNDIVQFDFMDSYGNLTYKTLSGLKWAAKFCAAAKYVMKTDTDMFVNTHLLPFLIKQAPTTLFMGGYCWGQSRPNREVSSKWFVSYKRYQHDVFPPMCSGTGYILSADVVRVILEKSQNIPFFHLEDVYLSLCLKDTGINPRRLGGFFNMNEEFEACYYKMEVITSHYMNPDLLYQYWDDIRSCDRELPDNIYREISYPSL